MAKRLRDYFFQMTAPAGHHGTRLLSGDKPTEGTFRDFSDSVAHLLESSDTATENIQGLVRLASDAQAIARDATPGVDGFSLAMQPDQRTSGTALPGADADVFKGDNGLALEFRGVSGTGGIDVTLNGDVIEVDGTGIGGVGEANTASNIPGGDVGVFKAKNGVDLEMRPLEGTGGIGVSLNGDVIEIDGSAFTGLTDSGWIALSLINGFSQFGVVTPSYRRIGDVLYFKGTITKNPMSSEELFANLPAGYRPVEQQRGLTTCNTNFGQDVDPTDTNFGVIASKLYVNGDISLAPAGVITKAYELSSLHFILT